ncbi:MAG TPA: hypothetical protein VIT62_00700 [Lysobacter sp.]
MLTLADIDAAEVAALLARYGLQLEVVGDGQPIPGSYWGECEAGLIGHSVYARGDTPVHSLLHEAAHLIVLPAQRRAQVHTDATDSIEEEDAVCVLQALLGDALPGVGRERVLADMDSWGYTFRLGSARGYFEHDADSAWQWLHERGLADAASRTLAPTAPADDRSGPAHLARPGTAH